MSRLPSCLGGMALATLSAWAQIGAIEVGTTRYDYQHNGSYGKMIAVSSDGVAHGVFMGGSNVTTGRRVLAWCVTPDYVLSGPANITETRAGYVTCATTSAEPGNGLPANSSVVGFHTSLGSWVGVDFDGCSTAFNLLQNTENIDILWPHIAVDYMDRIHMVCSDASTSGPNQDNVYYNSSTTGSEWDGPYQTVSIQSDMVSGIVTAAKQAPGAALLFTADSQCAPESRDLFCFETRDEQNDLRARINQGPPVNLTQTDCPESPLPYRFGASAYADVDAIYDSREEPHLLVAWSTPLMVRDTMIFEQDGLQRQPWVHLEPWRSAIWFRDVTSGVSSRIAGWLTLDDESDLPADSAQIGQYRCATDRVQLAHDPQTGYLYALWNQYSPDDLAEPIAEGQWLANGELYMACSADGGQSWGPRVNITDTPSPGCQFPNCQSETFASLAETAVEGYLHLSWLLDRYPGSSIYGMGLETVNIYYYLRRHVVAIPPHAGEAWDAAGHIGLGSYRRPWSFTNGHPASGQVVDRVEVFNESGQERHLESLILCHDSLDVFDGPTPEFTVDWDVMQGDPIEPGPWIQNPSGAGDWDGRLPANRRVLLHLSVAHEQLPMREQAFRFLFDDGTERVYRFVYEGPAGQGSLVMPMDLDQLESYVADTLYQRGESALPPVTPAHFRLLAAAPNPFNPVTQISFSLTTPGEAQLAVYNLRGERVAVLVDGALAAGQHRVSFAGDGLASGLYLALLEVEGRRETLKLLLTK